MGIARLLFPVLLLLDAGGQVFGQALLPPVAVTVARSTDDTGFTSPLELPELVVNIGNAWDRSDNLLRVNYNSTFFFHINAGAKPNEEVNMNLRGFYNADILRATTSHNGIDTTGRDFISPVVSGVSVKTENDADSHLFSDAGIETSFTAFDLSYYLSDTNQEIFCVYNQDRVTNIGRVPFPYKIVDTRNSWNSLQANSFYIRTTGYYFFTFSAGIDTATSMRAQIRSSNPSYSLISELYHESTSHNGQNTISKAVMVNLNAGDSVYIDLLEGTLYSDTERQTSFCGFRYDLGLVAEQAWSVYRTQSQAAVGAPVNPLTFGGSLVNIGGVFDHLTNHVTIPRSGLYYVQLTVAAQAGWPVTAYITKDEGYAQAAVLKTSNTHNGIESASTGLLLELTEGNKLSVTQGADTRLYSDADRHTTFTGFLLDPY